MLNKLTTNFKFTVTSTATKNELNNIESDCDIDSDKQILNYVQSKWSERKREYSMLKKKKNLPLQLYWDALE